MRKKEFLEELKEHLMGVSKEDKKEILQDYEEHFKIGKKNKRTESEISKSLGNPKIIAREVRRELSKETTKEELKSEAIETWVVLKKFAKHLFKEISTKTKIFIEEEKERFSTGDFTKELWVILILFIVGVILNIGFLIFLAFVVLIYSGVKYFKNYDSKNKKKTNKKSKTKKTNSKTSNSKVSLKNTEPENSTLKIFLSITFNILFFVWFWISLFCVLLSLIISGILTVIVGALIISFSIFALISYSNSETKDMLFSLLFAGFGTTLLGGLITHLFEKLIKYFFSLTKKYVELNMRFIRK